MSNTNMSNTKMLQILIDGQVEIKKELRSVLKKTDEELKKVSKRLDLIGKSLA